MTIDEAIALMRNEEARVVKADIRDRDYIKCELLGKTENLLSAYDMAIKALEREQESCEDTVSREAMLNYQQCLHVRISNEENHKFCEFIKGLTYLSFAREKRR